MRTNAEGASGAGNTARIWQRGATRRAILDAARLVADRTGSIEFSLNTVAKEAGYSPTTIFAYFATKHDLLNAIVADDLATLARTMQDSYPFPIVEHPEEAEGTEDTAGAVADPAPDSEPETGVAPSEPETMPVESIVGANADATPEEPSTVVVHAEAHAAKEPPRVDAWLERRLRVFEKTLADVESRLSAIQKESSGASALVEENAKIFGARLDASEKRLGELANDLSVRMSAAEKRVRDAQNELRNNLLNVSMRLDQLEAAAK
ncbi:MAG: TetR/AcrR family transcriptional regulator, partial [Rhizomicrobium sp.]